MSDDDPSMVCVTIERPKFFGRADEALFFQALNDNRCVLQIREGGGPIGLSLCGSEIDSTTLPELVELCQRWRIDPAPLLAVSRW